jgi:hypothetical protein
MVARFCSGLRVYLSGWRLDKEGEQIWLKHKAQQELHRGSQKNGV